MRRDRAARGDRRRRSRRSAAGLSRRLQQRLPKVAQDARGIAASPVDGFWLVSLITRPSLAELYSPLAALRTRPGGRSSSTTSRIGPREHEQRYAAAARGACPTFGREGCCADPRPVLRSDPRKPPEFSVMTGEDALFYAALRRVRGRILASAHIDPARFVGATSSSRRSAGRVARLARARDLPRLLFAEPARRRSSTGCGGSGFIDSPEVRLPMTKSAIFWRRGSTGRWSDAHGFVVLRA